MNKITGITMAMGVLAVVSCGTKQGTGSLIGAVVVRLLAASLVSSQETQP